VPSFLFSLFFLFTLLSYPLLNCPIINHAKVREGALRRERETGRGNTPSAELPSIMDRAPILPLHTFIAAARHQSILMNGSLHARTHTRTLHARVPGRESRGREGVSE
jgi:hypothetical protein